MRVADGPLGGEGDFPLFPLVRYPPRAWSASLGGDGAEYGKKSPKSLMPSASEASHRVGSFGKVGIAGP